MGVYGFHMVSNGLVERLTGNGGTVDAITGTGIRFSDVVTAIKLLDIP